jgi:hypothetical protein
VYNVTMKSYWVLMTRTYPYRYRGHLGTGNSFDYATQYKSLNAAQKARKAHIVALEQDIRARQLYEQPTELLEACLRVAYDMKPREVKITVSMP